MKHIAPLLAALASAALIGCTASAGDTPSADGPIRIAPFITRVSGPNFDPGDCIGLTVELPGSRYADNAPLTYDGKVFSSPDLIWYNDLHETSTLYAYYPYQAEATPARFTVRTDQRNAADYGASDLLAAVREAVTPAETAIDMRFDHLLSRLVVHIDNRSSAAAERVLIAGTVGTAEVNIATQHAAADATAPTVEIIARETDSGKTFDAILVPQTVKLTVVLLTSDGKRHEKTLDEARELRQGSRYTLDVIATDIDIALSLGGEIGDWDDGGSLDPAEEPAGEIRHGDATYRTHTFPDGTTWMAENLRYLPAGTTPSENPAGTGRGMVPVLLRPPTRAGRRDDPHTGLPLRPDDRCRRGHAHGRNHRPAGRRAGHLSRRMASAYAERPGTARRTAGRRTRPYGYLYDPHGHPHRIRKLFGTARGRRLLERLPARFLTMHGKRKRHGQIQLPLHPARRDDDHGGLPPRGRSARQMRARLSWKSPYSVINTIPLPDCGERDFR